MLLIHGAEQSRARALFYWYSCSKIYQAHVNQERQERGRLRLMATRHNVEGRSMREDHLE